MTKEILIGIALSVGASTMMLTSCSEQEVAAAEAPPEVKCVTIKKETRPYIKSWMGYVRGVNDTTLYPRVSGYIDSYIEGKEVKKGDVIFRINPEMFLAKVAQAEAELSAAKAQLEQAKEKRNRCRDDYERYVKSKSSISKTQIDQAKYELDEAIANIDVTLASIKTKEAALEQARINLADTEVKAPYDGFVGSSLVSTGALVSPSTKLGNIVSLGRTDEIKEDSDKLMRVDFSINSDALQEGFRKYGKAESEKPNKYYTKVPFELVFENGMVYEFPGELESMNNRIDDTGLVDVVGYIPNPDGKLQAGMKVNVKLKLAEPEEILVPEDALRTVMRVNFILVLDKDNVPHSIPVTRGRKYENQVLTDPNGYEITTNLVAVTSYTDEPLEQLILNTTSFDNITKVPVISDAERGVVAMNISSSNSRLAERKKALAEEYEAQQGSLWHKSLVALGLEDQVASPDSLTIQKVTPQYELRPDTQQAVSAAGKEMPPIPVKVSPLLRQNVMTQKEWFGSVRGINETDIRPQISGFIMEQCFRDGTIVHKGDVMYRIDPSTYDAVVQETQANLLSAQASYNAAVAAFKKAENDYNRKFHAMTKEGKGVITPQEVETASTEMWGKKAAIAQAEANIRQLEAALVTAKINRGYADVKAPFTGRAGISNVSQGTLVSPSDVNPLVSLSACNPMKELTIRPVPGRIISEMMVQKGSEVKQGDILCVLHSALAKGELEQANANLAESSAFEMSQDVKEARLKDVESKQQQVDEKALVIRAPFSGKITEVNYNIGDLLKESDDKDLMVIEEDVDKFDAESTQVRTQLKGVIKECRLNDTTTYVEKGDVLFVLDQSDLRDQISKNTSELMEINKHLLMLGENPEGDKKAESDKLTAQKTELQQKVAALQSDLDKTTIKAPITGLISQQKAKIGMTVSPEDAEALLVITPRKKINLYPETKGVLVCCNVESNSRVDSGDVIFTYNIKEYIERKATTEKELHDAIVALTDHETAYGTEEQKQTEKEKEIDYLEDLLERSSNQSQAVKKQIQERINKATAELDIIKKEVKRIAEAGPALREKVDSLSEAYKKAQSLYNAHTTYIKAPCPGIVEYTEVPQEVAGNSAEPLACINPMDPVRIDFRVSADDGMILKENMKFEVVKDEGDIYPAKGRIVSPDSAINKGTGTLSLVGMVENVDSGLRSGQAVTVRAATNEYTDAFMVPMRAALNANGMDVLVLVGKDNSPDMLPITKIATVTIPVTEHDGQIVEQPMQIFDINRPIIAAEMCKEQKVNTLDDLVLGGAKVKSWDELLLKNSNAASYVELLNQPDCTDEAKAKEIFFKMAGVKTAKELLLAKAGAADVLDFMARGQKCSSALEMIVRGMGYDPKTMQVVVEGSINAAQAYGANMALGKRTNKLVPVPFKYTKPRTVEPSITAESAPVSNIEKF